MKSTDDLSDGLNLQTVAKRIRELLEEGPHRPTAEQITDLCNVLYASSLLKEEGRPVRARIVIAPPDAFDGSSGPPDGVHVVRFSVMHRLTANEIKSLSPAADFFHSIIGIWPDRDRGFRIWGIINTGPRWLNQVAGGRKPVGERIRHSIIHVRDPGWLLFFHEQDLIAEWRGQGFRGPRIDVFRSPLLRQRFERNRLAFVENLIDCCLPASLNAEAYADLAHLISLQFVKRIVSLVRTSGHGGSLVFLPEDPAGLESALEWIDCKYSAAPEEPSTRFRSLLEFMIRRVGELCEDGATADDAWALFKNSSDTELDRLEEAFFELAQMFADMMQVDGALVLDKSMRLVGFGGEIRVDRNVIGVGHARDLEGSDVVSWNVLNDGTRHRSVYRLCSVEPEIIGFVISQDSHVRMIANVDDSVVFWQHTMI
jgi:hypothetical protein